MLLTTTHNIEGHVIQQYIGIVTGEAVMGANFMKDWFASIRDVVGGRSGAYEQELKKARDAALEELTAAAQQAGANAVVGIDLDYEVLGDRASMLMVTASGTAVYIS